MWWANLYWDISNIKYIYCYYIWHIVETSAYMFCISEALYHPEHYDATCQNLIIFFCLM